MKSILIFTLILMASNSYSYCPRGQLCRDALGNQYVINNQGRTVYLSELNTTPRSGTNPALMNGIMNPAQVDVVGSLAKGRERQRQEQLYQQQLEINELRLRELRRREAESQY